MNLPLVFLLGVFAMAGAAALASPLPGSSHLPGLLLAVLSWPVPTLLARGGLRRIRERMVAGRRHLLHPRWWLRASAAASPPLVLLTALPGGWLDAAERWSTDSHLLHAILLTLPVFCIELPRQLLAHVGWLWLEGEPRSLPPGIFRVTLPGLANLWPILRVRLGWPLLLPVPLLLLSAGLDLLRLWPELHEFCASTTVGSTAGLLVVLGLLSLLLPFVFRHAFGAHRALPEPIGSMLRDTAAQLGFPPRQLMLLPTGGRAINALLVGPLPIGRTLCLTDGLLQSLGPTPLMGVVAHEVGHARMGHPGMLLLLVAVVPLLLVAPAGSLLADGDMDPLWQAMLALLMIGFGWTAIRWLAHRFEHEADIASVRAFGAGPCTQALLAVSASAMPIHNSWWGRLSSLHPEERVRCQWMMRYEMDPGFRSSFDATGKRLRYGLLAGVLAVFGLAALQWQRDWPYEHTVWRLHCGDIAGAAALVAAIEEPVPLQWQRPWRQVRDHVAAAVALAPTARSWESAQSAYAEQAWPRGVSVLLEDGPAAARPWLALAVAGDSERQIARRLVFEYCRAAAENDPDRMEQARLLLLRHGIPPGLEAVFRD